MDITGIAAILGTLGGFELVKYLVNLFVKRKYNRRKENAEADKAEQEADDVIIHSYEERLKSMSEQHDKVIHSYEERLKSMSEQHDKAVHSYEERLKELRASNTELNTLLLNNIKEKSRKDDIIDDKNAHIRKVNEELVTATRHIGHLEKELVYFKNWKCFREYGRGKNECTRREPQQNPPLKYSPLDCSESQDD